MPRAYGGIGLNHIARLMSLRKDADAFTFGGFSGRRPPKLYTASRYRFRPRVNET